MRRLLINSLHAVRRNGRRILYRLRFGGSVSIDPSTWISRRAILKVTGGGSISIGKHCEIHDYAMIATYGGDIELGDHCSLNPFSIIYGHGGVRIGEGVRIAAHSIIIPSNHNIAGDQPIRLAGETSLGIEIGDNVWLGSGTRILDGVRIGDDAVIGAGSVVTRAVARGSTVAGVPARPISVR